MKATAKTVYRCGHCGRCYFKLTDAETCCTRPCAYAGCDAVPEMYQNYCRQHRDVVRQEREQARLDKAELIDYGIDPDSPVCLGDDWYYEAECAAEHYDCLDDVPEFAYVPEWHQLALDLCDMVCDHCGEFSSCVDDCDDTIGWPLPAALNTELASLTERLNAHWADTGAGCWEQTRRQKFCLREQLAPYFDDDSDDQECE